MKNAGIIFGLLFLLQAMTARALPPIASHICEASALAVFHSTMGDDAREHTRQAVHRMRMFRSRQFQDIDPTAGIATGRRNNEGRAKGLSRAKLAARLKGLEKFAASEESGRLDTQNITRGIVIEGQKDIETFLDSMEQNLNVFEGYHQEFWKPFKGAFFVYAFVLLNLQSPRVWEILRNPAQDPAGTLAILAGLLFLHIFKIDVLYSRPLRWDYSWRSNTAYLRAKLDDLVQGRQAGWHFDSQNFSLFDLTLAALENQRNPSPETINNQSVMESLPFLMMPMEYYNLKTNPKFTRHWVGIDRLLDSNDKGEPRLSIVVRYSRRRPIFPKTSPARERGWIPGLSPAADAASQLAVPIAEEEK